VRHKFELTFLEVSAKNKHLFFFQILTGAKYNFSSYGSEAANRSAGIIFRFFADAIQPAEGKPLGPGIRHRNVEWRKPIILYPKSYAVTWVRTKAGSHYTEADISGMWKSTP